MVMRSLKCIHCMRKLSLPFPLPVAGRALEIRFDLTIVEREQTSWALIAVGVSLVKSSFQRMRCLGFSAQALLLQGLMLMHPPRLASASASASGLLVSFLNPSSLVSLLPTQPNLTLPYPTLPT